MDDLSDLHAGAAQEASKLKQEKESLQELRAVDEQKWTKARTVLEQQAVAAAQQVCTLPCTPRMEFTRYFNSIFQFD